MSKDRIRVSYTVHGQPILNFFMAPKRGVDPGFIFGLKENLAGLEVSDYHLTTVVKDNHIESHVKIIKGGETEYCKNPLFTFDEINKKMERAIKRYTRKLHWNTVVYIPINELKENLLEIYEKYGDGIIEEIDGSINIPLEYHLGTVEVDIENTHRWKRKRLCQIMPTEFFCAVIMDGEVPRFIYPLNEKDLYFCISDRQFRFLQGLGGRINGMMIYLEQLLDDPNMSMVLEEKIKKRLEGVSIPSNSKPTNNPYY